MESKLDIKHKSDCNKCKASLILEVGKCENKLEEIHKKERILRKILLKTLKYQGRL